MKTSEMSALIAVIVTLLGGILASVVTRRLVWPLLQRIVRRTPTLWDDVLNDEKLARYVSLVVAFGVFVVGVGTFPTTGVWSLSDEAADIVQRVIWVFFLVFQALVLSRLLTAFHDVYATLEVAESRPLKGYLQLVKIFIFIIIGVVIVAVITGQPVGYYVTGLGAMTAVLLLIFQDTILSLVASLQLTQNDMVRVGDWIQVPNCGVDGTVVDLALHTMKVRNWDNSTATIPTHQLVSESFLNWRGMTDAGLRRIKRSLFIDATRVRFLTEEEVEKFRSFPGLSDYIQEKKAAYMQEEKEEVLPDRGIRKHFDITNLGILRAYIEAYLRELSVIESENATLLVRHLSPTSQGIPIEVYAFFSSTEWVPYENAVSDIFDHLIATLPLFDLRLFQEPTGFDFRSDTDTPLQNSRKGIFRTGGEGEA